MKEAITDGGLRELFAGAGDFIARELHCGQWTLWAYAIDGLTSGSDMSEYVLRPITEILRGDSMEELYRHLLNRDKDGAKNWSNLYLAEAIRGSQQIYDA